MSNSEAASLVSIFVLNTSDLFKTLLLDSDWNLMKMWFSVLKLQQKSKLNKTPNAHKMLLLRINQMTIKIKTIAQRRGHSHNPSVLSVFSF